MKKFLSLALVLVMFLLAVPSGGAEEQAVGSGGEITVM